MSAPRVLVLYNEPTLPLDHPDAESEYDILQTADALGRALIEAGFRVARLGARDDPGELIAGLRRAAPDAVLNLFEGTAVHGNTEAFVAGILEWLGLPFTGSPATALTLGRSKPMTKQVLLGAGVSTPGFFTAEALPVPACPLPWPVIVKPAREDASVGIDQGSVVTNQAALADRVEYILDRYGAPVLVEQFVRGREFNVGLTELPDLRTLPLTEIRFEETGPGQWPILSFDAKWKPKSTDFRATPVKLPADVEPRLAKKIGELARRAFRVVGCRDYARVDFRVDESGRPFVLEVNPNPCVSPEAGLAAGLQAAGVAHRQFVVDLVTQALRRGGKAPADADTPLPHHLATSPPDGGGGTAVRTRVKPWLVRPVRAVDRAAVAAVAVGCGTFEAELHAEALDRLARAARRVRRPGDPEALVAHAGREVGGVAAFAPVPLARGAYALEALAVRADLHGRGLGRQLLRAVEERLAALGARVLVAEVSSQPAFAAARAFLQRQGFRLVGDLPDFYRPDHARLTFAKYLPPATADAAGGPRLV
jgi:D-alanine-D-alanine ligase